MTMLEKVAEAMYRALEGGEAMPRSDWIEDTTYFDDVKVDGTVDLKKLARAALMAIREPDWAWGEKVVESDTDASPYNPHPVAAFTAMIDAILNEEGPPPPKE
ncbi:hypothetical protein [Brevundimonas sp. Root1279]|uniref:hypothetical protein n=1 Tax=Brevundimonas sp. Root1279 TaxID=1736443 RepID=UPI0006FAAD69|nr:hypothetical protein [Brevundimonas sp. Root1279]KQW79696.1 hypothetical protein ASC65_14200 [Brevundimonas sp. Root1279]